MYDHDRYYYDKAGNLLDNEGQGPVMNNRLPGCGRDRYGYNEWGELTTRRDQQLEWNAQGQLTRVISGNTETHYGYDALGRRTRKATYGRHTGHTARSRTDFVWEGFRLLQENVQQQGWRTYLYDAEQPYTPVASVTGRGESRQVWYYHTDVTGMPQEVTAADGTLVWAGYIRGFGENAADISNSGAYFHQPLRLPGQYFDDETGLHYNLFRYYAPECGRFVSQDPIGLKGGLNLYSYAPNPLSWIDPLGLSCRTDFLGRTPGKNSRTGREVIERMRAEGKIVGTGKNTRFEASDGSWHPLNEADMSHKTDAVTWWNNTGRYLGPKSKPVRDWMLNSDNYYLDHYSINRSQGAQLGQVYLPPVVSP
ncbi:RHS repeat protein [Salmonella enterica subsp. enterica serovar Typhimurium]|nr:RHS repeat protein [Salmonella enterica subsp. enterica serovar Typhimurium]